GSVPHARRVQRQGGDVQLVGFLQPRLSDDEELCEDSCSAEGIRNGYKVLLNIIQILEQHARVQEAGLGDCKVEPFASEAKELPYCSGTHAQMQGQCTVGAARSAARNGATEDGGEASSCVVQPDEPGFLHPMPPEVIADSTARRARSLEDGEEASSPVPFRRCFSDSFQPLQAEETKIQWPEREGRE
ncbi:unnamed protein product, partial [Durusdinium trenchii]